LFPEDKIKFSRRLLAAFPSRLSRSLLARISIIEEGRGF
jgi:hypothetical protein